MSKRKSSPWKIFIAIALAIVIGSWSGTDKTIFGVNLYSLFDILGTLFINALSLVVVPLVSSSIISGVAKIGKDKSFKRLGIKTFTFYIGTSLIAILIGLCFVNILRPGISMSGEPLINVAKGAVEAVEKNMLGSHGANFLTVLMNIVPSNVLDAFSKGNMLGLIFFSIIFGIAVSKIDTTHSKTLFSFFNGVFQSMIQFTHMILFFLPLGVFCLVAKAFATTTHGFQGMGYFLISVVLGLIVFMFIALPILIKVIGKTSPLKFFRAMTPALVTAFSTSSSSASLPVTLDCIEKRGGVSNRIASLVIPLGASINMSGSALYDVVAAIFVVQAYGFELSFMHQVFIALLALLTSIGIAGVPSGSLVAIIVILKIVGIPVEGIGLFIAVDRICDMLRTTVNVFSDSTCALLVARTEGEETQFKDIDYAD
jgi:Na+/H+-dicarboxylate symporter